MVTTTTPLGPNTVTHKTQCYVFNRSVSFKHRIDNVVKENFILFSNYRAHFIKYNS